jgi:hypothetical protein
MSRLILLLVVMLLSACSTNKKAIDDIERRHNEDLQRMG